MMRTTNTASVPKSRLQTSVPEPKSRRSTFHAGARVCCDASIAFVWRRPIGGGPSPGRPRKGGESRTSSWGGSLDSGGRAGPVGLGVHARESSVMSVHAVMRALRKNKTLRYGVPMLIDPELEKKLKMNKVSLESEYEKIKDSAFDDWKNIRGPRPWEDPDLLQGQNPEILKTKTT